MKLAIMQPYFMPYIGYFQLIKAVDKFIIYDDVTYIKQGWINRNQLLINGEARKFTIPISNGSSNNLIKDVVISNMVFDKWKITFYKTLMSSYRRAPYYNNVLDLMDRIINCSTNYISELAVHSIEETLKYLNISRDIVRSSEVYNNNNELMSQNRVLDICKKESAKTYINPIGGQELYSQEIFRHHGLELFFIKTKEFKYQQFTNEFVPWLSIIDVLMFNSSEEINEMLDNYELI